MMMNKTKRHKGAFTMIELVVVIGIIVLLSGLLVVGLGGLSESAGTDKTRAVLVTLKTGAEYYSDANRIFGNWGTDSTDLTTYYNDVEGLVGTFDEHIKDRRVQDGTVMRYKDGFENYVRVNRKNSATVEFVSAGSDGTFGTDDDISVVAKAD